MSYQFQYKIEELRMSVVSGGEETATGCERQLAHALSRHVRRVVRTGRIRNGLTAEIHRELLLVRSTCPDLERDEVVAEVTSRLCSKLIGRGYEDRIETAQVVETTAVVA